VIPIEADMETGQMQKCDLIEKMINISADERGRTSKVVARSFFRILAKNGFSHSDIMDFAGNLLDEVMKDMGASGEKTIRPETIEIDSGEAKEVA
jgi:hypothetical protein